MLQAGEKDPCAGPETLDGLIKLSALFLNWYYISNKVTNYHSIGTEVIELIFWKSNAYIHKDLSGIILVMWAVAWRAGTVSNIQWTNGTD